MSSGADGSTSNPRTDVSVTTNKSVTATFTINIYTITVQQSSGGTISPGTSFVTYGGSKTFTITPNTGYHISGVNVDGGTAVGAVSSYTFSNVNFNHLITAGFTINTYILNYTAGANGTISGTSLQTVNYGSSGTAVTAVANTGYHFVQWSDGSTSNPRTDVSVTTNKSVTATFTINIYTITVQQSSGGTISPGTSFVTYGGSKTFTITPNTGYHISGVNVDGGTAVGAVSSYTFSNVNFNHLITAGFVINTYALNVTTVGNGTVTKNPATGPYNYNTSVTVTATAATGYIFTGWSGSASDTTNPLTVTMNGNKTITANFSQQYSLVTLSAIGFFDSSIDCLFKLLHCRYRAAELHY